MLGCCKLFFFDRGWPPVAILQVVSACVDYRKIELLERQPVNVLLESLHRRSREAKAAHLYALI